MTKGGEAAGALLDAGVLILTPDEPITFASGIRSPVYMDIRRLIASPHAWKTVISAMKRMLVRSGLEPDVLGGVAVGGIPHSSALAYSTGLASCFVRKQAKQHGRGRAVEGADVSGRSVVLVEDVVTTGGSSLEAVKALREAGARVEVCMAVAGYGFGQTFSTFRAEGVELWLTVPFVELLEAAAGREEFSPEHLSEARRWWADPHHRLPGPEG